MLNSKKFGTIAASIALAGLISAFTPTVTEAQNSQPVKVTNGLAAPVPVRDIDNARQPIQLHKTLSMAGSAASTLLFAVPAGKRLVIESATVRAEIGSSELPNYAQIMTNTTDPNPGIAAGPIMTVFHELLVTRQGEDLSGRAVFVGTHSIRLYSEPNTFVFFQFGRTTSGTDGLIQVSISGYLVDV